MSANTADDARLDIKTRGFWSRGQDAYFDVRVFYPNASSYRSLSLKSAYKRHKDAKKREYGHRVRDIEHGVFTPLVFTSTGSMGREATVFYRCLADLLATHWGQQYSQTINWLRCRLSFALLRCEGSDTFGNLVRLLRNHWKSLQKSLEIRKSGFMPEILNEIKS